MKLYNDQEVFAALCVWEWVVENQAYTGHGVIVDREDAMELGRALEAEYERRGYNGNEDRPRPDTAWDVELIPELCELLWSTPWWNKEVSQAFDKVFFKQGEHQ